MLLFLGDRTTSFSDFISLQPDHPVHESGSEGIGTGSSMQDDEPPFNDIHDSKVISETTGNAGIDRMLLQHLIHCEYLLQVIRICLNSSDCCEKGKCKVHSNAVQYSIRLFVCVCVFVTVYIDTSIYCMYVYETHGAIQHRYTVLLYVCAIQQNIFFKST